MRKLILALAFLAIINLATAQQSRIEVTNTHNAAVDNKPNSDKVPEVYALTGQFDRVLVLRFKYQADLLTGLERMVKENKIRNAVILSGIGSVRGYHYHTVSNRSFPSQEHLCDEPDRSGGHRKHERLRD